MIVRLFGIAKDIVGQDELNVPDTVQVRNVSALKKWIFDNYPDFHKLKTLAVAVNQEYASDETLLEETPEIALIPPVSGG